jgi:eukaryotic-like serine/threonine-protein kinase
MPPSPSSVKTLAGKILRIALLAALFMTTAGIGTYLALTTIIKGEKTVTVPNLVGKDVLDVLEILSDLGLNTRVKGTVYSDRVPKNHVIDQDPQPGTSIKRGRDVKIRVSRGPETIVMPNLAGLSLQQGQILLKENGLCQGSIAGMTDARSAADQIMAQYPTPGATVTRQTCTDLLISRGPAPPAFAMTDLSGFTLGRAIRRLGQLQLKPGRISRIHDPDAPPDTVVEQTPPAGYRVSLGSRVDLTVNQSAGQQASGHVGDDDQVALFRFSLKNGFLKRRVQVKLNLSQMSLTLFDEYLSPGQEIWLSVPERGNPTLLVYVDGQLVESRMMSGN